MRKEEAQKAVEEAKRKMQLEQEQLLAEKKRQKELARQAKLAKEKEEADNKDRIAQLNRPWTTNREEVMEMRSFLRMHFGSDELALSGLDTKFPTGLARSPDFQDLLVHNKYCLAVRAIKLFKLLDKDRDDFVRVEDIIGMKRPPPEKPEIVEPETAPVVELPLPAVTSTEPLTVMWKVGAQEKGHRILSG